MNNDRQINVSESQWVVWVINFVCINKFKYVAWQKALYIYVWVMSIQVFRVSFKQM